MLNAIDNVLQTGTSVKILLVLVFQDIYKSKVNADSSQWDVPQLKNGMGLNVSAKTVITEIRMGNALEYQNVDKIRYGKWIDVNVAAGIEEIMREDVSRSGGQPAKQEKLK